MKKKSNKLELILLIVFLVIAVFLLYYYFYSDIGQENTPTVQKTIVSQPTVQYDSQKQELLSDLQTFQKYGDWPEIPFQLSPSRGNPFMEKQAENNQ